MHECLPCSTAVKVYVDGLRRQWQQEVADVIQTERQAARAKTSAWLDEHLSHCPDCCAQTHSGGLALDRPFTHYAGCRWQVA